MDFTKGIRLLAASLSIFTGVVHLAMAALVTESQMAVLALFGVLYVIVGIGLFAGKRLFSYLGVVIPVAGTIIATYAYVASKPEPATLTAIAIDVIIILCCCYLILHKTK